MFHLCGIAGVLSFSGNKICQSMLHKIAEKLNHRGPDGSGLWISENIGFAHTRLSIHDLTQLGRQPMFSFNKKWIIVFNGEIYNFNAIKRKLLNDCAITFDSNSDTEVLVNAIAVWGIEKTLQLAVGMFAFAAYNIFEKILYLARDRFGEKPLYYGIQKGVLGFSSELKALIPLMELGWQFEVDRDVLATYMRLGYIPTPYSIYRNIHKLEQGSYLQIDAKGHLQSHYFWEAKNFLTAPRFIGDYQSAVNILEHKLKESVKMQMTSDVPLGAFLSGGVDSSTIVALMQAQSSQKIRTFSIGFYDAAFNEAIYAKEVAEHLGTNHTEFYISQKDALAVIPKLSSMYDEPFADSSQIPTHLVSKIARTQVTVSLSGDAGDELFGGYERYLIADKVKKNILDKKSVRYFVTHTPKYLLGCGKLFSRKLTGLSDKLIKLQRIALHGKNAHLALYYELCSQIANEDMLIDGREKPIFLDKGLRNLGSLSYQEWMMYVDSQLYMMDDILTKVDRAAMAVSLETRMPFLDHHIYEFAWSLPLEYKICNGITKKILRDVLYRYVPQKLIDRPKWGFGIPLGKWLRNDLKSWAEELLNPVKLSNQGYFNVNLVQNYWKEHLSGKRDWGGVLWTILMFQMWYEHNFINQKHF